MQSLLLGCLELEMVTLLRANLRLKVHLSQSTYYLFWIRCHFGIKNSIGRKYADFMDSQGISADTRMPVRFVDDDELAYVIQRYREIHDFIHLLLDFPSISEHDEIAVKWFEAAQTGLPMCYLSGLVGPLRLSSTEKVGMYTKLAPWALSLIHI